jgi:hypothetical protein
LYLLLVLRIQDLEDVSCRDFCFSHIGNEMRVISYRYPSKEYLIDCSKNIQKTDPIISHKNSPYVKEHTKDDESQYL